MHLITLIVAVAAVFGAAVVQLVGALRDDGHGRNPPPRSHRAELHLRQDEQLRRLAR